LVTQLFSWYETKTRDGISQSISDAHNSYKSYTSKTDLEHVIINGSKKEYVKKGIYHLSNINNYHSRLKKWISSFNGVSTKYLQLYLVWFQFLGRSLLVKSIKMVN
jgi:transposase-like protein